MSEKPPILRYGHIEGTTEICFTENGNQLISCGYGGEVRIWKGIGDDEPSTITAGEHVYSVAVKGEALYVAPDNHSVNTYKLPDGEEDGILMRFTGNVTHLAVSESKKYVAAGSSDFDIKIINIETKKQKHFLGHQAPILSVSLDPNDEFLASTSCDGKMKIWNVHTESCIKTIQVISPSNDVGNSLSLARLCWRPATGEDIAVPTSDGIKIYSRITWAEFQTLKTTETTKPFHCCSFSPCGRFVAAASVDGWIIVWDAETQECLRTMQHPLRTCICSVAWNPKENNSIAFSDTRGQVGVLEDVILSEQPTKPRSSNDLDDLFEEEDDNLMVDLMAEEDKEANDDLPVLKKSRTQNLFESDDEDDAKKQSQNSGLPDIPPTLDVFGKGDVDNDLAPPSIPASLPAHLFDDEDASSRATGSVVLPSNHIPMASMQPPFQPGSTPVHLSHRFMVWNAVGIVRSYDDEVENAIDVEFHDTQTHHAFHISNTDRFMMADLSDKAVVLASQFSEDSSSKVKCVHFSSWDNNKEWTMNMEGGEDIQAITTGESWFALATDSLQVRLFSLGGAQRQIFSVPGQVVAMAAHTDQLLIAYHVTQGVNRNQCIAFMLLEVGAGSGCHPRKIVAGQPLPISAGSTLAWLGFTVEGTPGTVDSAGVVRLFNREFCGVWAPVANLKKLAKSRHDNYWVVGLHENPQQIRCVLCKGSAYPSTLPRPTITVQPYSLPLCEMETDKSKLEEEYWRTKLFSTHGDYLSSRGYEVDSANKQKFQLEMQHTLMKLFALCCKSDQEFQAQEVCSLMPTSASINLAIKYASRLKRIMLAQRLQEVAQDKMEEEKEVILKEQRKKQQFEEVEEDEEEEEVDFRTEMQAGYSATETEWSTRRAQPTVTNNAYVSDEEGSDVEITSQKENKVAVEKPTRSLSSQLAGSRRNPFKKSAASIPKPVIPSSTATNLPAPSSGGVLDGIKRPTPTTQRRTLLTTSEISKKLKGKESNKKKTTQSTLKLNLTSTPKPKKAVSRMDEQENKINVDVLKEKVDNHEKSKFTAVQLFIQEKLSEVQEEHPNLDGIDARKMVINMFRALSPDQKKEWNERARTMCAMTPSTGTKRKHESENSDDTTENSPPGSSEENNENGKLPKNQKIDVDPTNKSVAIDVKSKLSAFSYAGDD